MSLKKKLFKWTAKQKTALQIIASYCMYVLLVGGSRSGKTFVLCRCVALRAIKAPGSRHCILRLIFNDVKKAIIYDTFPKMMALCFPEMKKGRDWKLNKSDWCIYFPRLKDEDGNEAPSEIWFGGLDTKERMEKILGLEYVTIYLNEVSQIPYSGLDIIKTRLAQVVYSIFISEKTGKRVRKRMRAKVYFDCNPPPKSHWTYKLFIKKTDPISQQPLPDKGRDYDFLFMNPKDNEANLSPEYIQKILGSLTGRSRKRFLEGKFLDAYENALWTDEVIDRYRIPPGGHLPAFKRVVVGIDPSGADDQENAENDEIGIVVAALGTDNHGYVLEDVTIKAGPATWGRVAVEAYHRHLGDAIVGEKNYGGAMVEFVVKAADRNVKYIGVTASRGKAVRAEPISALQEQGQIHHVGYFPEMEEEMCSCTTVGYLGDGSPNRMDAMVWCMTELFPQIAQTKKRAGALR